MGIAGPCLMAFCSTDYNAVRTAFGHAQVGIRIALSVRRQMSAAFRIRHGPIDHQILFLAVLQVPKKACVIIRSVFLVDLEGDGKNGIHGIHAHTALEAGGGFLP